MASPSRISAVHKNMANIYTNAKKFDLALEHFQRALEIDRRHDPENHLQFGQTYANMGTMYQSKKNYNEALVHFEKARETWLKTLLPTHLSIEKIEKTICKVKSKLGKPQNCPEDNFAVIDNAARNNTHIEPSLGIQVNITSNSLRLTTMSDIEVDWNLLKTT
jgi:tetratricopeptide (TPR) repeat protein